MDSILYGENPPMFLAVKDGDLEMIKKLNCEQGMSLDIKNEGGCTLLHCAALYGQLEVAQYLIRNNCDINIKDRNGQTALLTAAYWCKRDVFKMLVLSGADLSGFCCYDGEWSVLHFASFYEYTDIVRIIVENGSLDVSIKNPPGLTPLMLAVHCGYEDIVDLLIGAGAECSSCSGKEQKNLLHFACCTPYYGAEGLQKLVKYLIERGETDLNAESVDKWTPLLYAADKGKKEVAEILIRAGADPNRSPHPFTGQSVLYLAAAKGWTNIVQMIVEKGSCDLNCRDSSGLTPLHTVCRNFPHFSEIIKLLIRAGADVNIRDHSQSTALSSYIFADGSDIESIGLLVQNGAYFGDRENQKLSLNPTLKELVEDDATLCKKSLVNKFNNFSLPAVYAIPAFCAVLPQMDTLTINDDKSMAAKEIAKLVEAKTVSDVLEACPIVLKLMCVECLKNCNQQGF